MTITDSPSIRNQNPSSPALNQEQDGKFSKGVDKATSGAHQKIDDAKNASKPAVDQAAQGAHAAVDKASDMVSRSAEALDHKSEQLGEAKDEFVRATQKYVHENPMASIGIAVAVGFVLSRILSS